LLELKQENHEGAKYTKNFPSISSRLRAFVVISCDEFIQADT